MLRLGYVRMSDIGLKRLSDGSLISVSEPTPEMTTRLAEPELFSRSLPTSNDVLSNPALLLEASRPAPSPKTHEVLVSGYVNAPAQIEPRNSNYDAEPAAQTIEDSPLTIKATLQSKERDVDHASHAPVKPRLADDITAVDHNVDSDEDWDAIIAKARARAESEVPAPQSEESEADWDAVIAKAREAAA